MVVQEGKISSALAVDWLVELLGLNDEGTLGAMEEIAIRLSHAKSQRELHPHLKKFLIALSQEGPMELIKAFFRGLKQTIRNAGASPLHKRAAITLCASVIGKRYPQPVLKLLQERVETEPSDATRVTMVEAISYVMEERNLSTKPINESLVNLVSRDTNVRTIASVFLSPFFFRFRLRCG